MVFKDTVTWRLEARRPLLSNVTTYSSELVVTRQQVANTQNRNGC
jgi:hypothetical protein